MIIHSSFADFLVFLYVHISEADHNYDPKEMYVIKQKMADLFPGDTDFEKKLYSTIRLYNTLDKSQLNDLLEDSFHHFVKDDDVDKNRIYRDLKEIIDADGKVENAETNALDILMKIIETSSKNLRAER